MKIVIPIDREEDKPWYRLHGGGWPNDSRGIEVALRTLRDPSFQFYYYGFRIVRRKK